MPEGAGAEVAGIPAITKAAALAYRMFNLYTPPCFAAIGAMNAEMKSAKWLRGGMGLRPATGYTVSYAVYRRHPCDRRLSQRSGGCLRPYPV